MRDKDTSLAFQSTLYDLIYNLASGLGVESRYWVIHEDNVRVGVYCTSKAQPGFLAARQVDTIFTDFLHVSRREGIYVFDQLAGLDRFQVPGSVEGQAKQYIVSDRFVLDPRIG